MRNDELIHAVKDELERDPDVDSDVVAVSADDGVVRLRGTVESLGEKHEAERMQGASLIPSSWTATSR
jgi:osmotically-inducible protein OsmY